jgi:hypothetical protein
VLQGRAEETGGRLRAVKRQDNGGDGGIVEVLVEPVGSILQIIPGCEIGDDSGSVSGNGGDGSVSQ